MRKYLSSFAILLALPLTSCAQWYLFPGNQNKTEQEIRKEETASASSAVQESTHESDEPDVQATEEEQRASWLFPSMKRGTINLSLILPMGAMSEKTNSNYVEMYCGALLALRDLASDGVKVKLNFVDCAAGMPDPYTISDSDVIIGPVGYDDVMRVSALCPDGKYLVSPLDPKTAELAASHNVIQAPTPWSSQIDELVDWLKEDTLPGDKILVIRDKSSSGFGEQSRYLIERLDSKGIKYDSYASIREIDFDKNFNYRIVVASDSDSFLTGAVRNTALAAARNSRIHLYCTSKIRSSIGTNVTDLYDCRTRLVAAYHIDYDSQKVKDFVLAYRALFNSEPGSFAFQGYDIVHYFVNSCHLDGRNWHHNLPRYSEKGLQSDFKYDRWEGDGKINVGVRRVIYNKDLTTTLVQ